MVMVDWISCCIPWQHASPINNGNVVSISPDGEQEWHIEKWLPVSGSFDSTIQIRSKHSDTYCSHILLSGNPIKFLQGHNVWGSGDVTGLVFDTFLKVLSLINIPGQLPSYPMASINTSWFTRIDLTAMYHLRDGSEVNNWLRSAEFAANTRHSGRGQMTNGTLYFGKTSRRWSLKFYHKGQELNDNKKHQRDLPPEVLQFADKSLRCEVTLRGKELDEIGLANVFDWEDVEAEDVYNRYLNKLELSDNMHTVEPAKLKNLPPRLVAVYHCWTRGDDIREMLSRNTFYRYRKQLKEELGINISVRQPSTEPDRSNVVPLVRILEAKPVEIPHWAYGTDLYYEPNMDPKLRLAQ